MKNLFLATSLAIFTTGIGLAQPIQKATEKPADATRILTYNIRYCKGMDDKINPGRQTQVINRIQPDVIGLQEVDMNMERSNNIDTMDLFSKQTNMVPFYGKAYQKDSGSSGNGLLSKEIPVKVQSKIKFGRNIIIAEFKDFVVFTTHLHYKNVDTRMKNAIDFNDMVEQYDKPVFLFGDLNAHPDSDEIKELEKKWVILNNRDIPTCPSPNPRATIDYIMGSKKHADQYEFIDSKVIDEKMASDHLPVYADIRLKKKN